MICYRIDLVLILVLDVGSVNQALDKFVTFFPVVCRIEY